MFAKPFRVKSNIVLKGSDRKKLKADVSEAFPTLTAEQLSSLVPQKEEINVVKIYTHSGKAGVFYTLHKNPIFFEAERRLYPTVYTLWSFPDLMPAFATWPTVIQKLAGGADLMLPGVVVPPCGLPEVKAGDVCSINVAKNRAPHAVGTATMSTADMMQAGMKGKGFLVFHTYTDQLWAFGDKSSPPELTPLVPVSPEEDDHSGESDNEAEGPFLNSEGDLNLEPITSNLQEVQLSADSTESKETRDEDTLEDGHCCDEEQSPQEQMDELLFQCFLHALKSKVKKSELPLLTSTFLRNYMVSCCPSGKQLDVKKSSYKKLSKFLQCMQKQHSLIQVKELTKGVESIVEVDWRHQELQRLGVLEESLMDASASETSKDYIKTYQPPEISTIYGVSSKLALLFQNSQHKKGDLLTATEVRTIVTDYVKTNELVHTENKNYINVNPILCDCLLDKSEQHETEVLKWDDLFSRCLDRMQPYHQLMFPDQPPIIRKGHIAPIDISVASRGSNKKVTLIKNLELYGLEPQAVASCLQQRVQASSTISPLPGSKDKVQVQIQGNQVNHVGRLLLEEYNIPRKYIQGLDKAAKPGKKK
ncbi:eukaryotic translation initiation factor 2D isoform X1 [Polypterus senegalus]|uniref:eukaryotic translation initiation factor 2D isoform X1 n=2 Tax=Polypterus senegalus TaxID=55291 RepID=UPI0019664C78|nr:eukaryotic translation initiation factor 2D isoform X1 [Polypterus senegalus]